MPPASASAPGERPRSPWWWRFLEPRGYHRFDAGKVTQPWLWLLSAAREDGWTGTLAFAAGLRTAFHQLWIYGRFRAHRGAPAFLPWEPSRHLVANVRRLGDWSLAIDTQDVDTLIDFAARRGIELHRPHDFEPWHVQAVRPFVAPPGPGRRDE